MSDLPAPSLKAFVAVVTTAVAPELLIDGSGHFEGTAQGTGFWMTLDVTSVWPPHGAQTDTLFTQGMLHAATRRPRGLRRLGLYRVSAP